MIIHKRPEANLKLHYRKVMEICVIGSLVIHLFIFRALPAFDLGADGIKSVDIKIQVEEIPQTEQIKKAPPPPRPAVPIPTESEDVPEDLTIEATDLDLSDLPMPPPPPEDDGVWDSYAFIPYDEAPTPVGGFGAIQKHLKYPQIARKAGIEARVVVGVLIDEKGRSVKTQILQSSGYTVGFEAAAEAAVSGVRWRPAKQRDEPVKVWVSIPINFKLDHAGGT